VSARGTTSDAVGWGNLLDRAREVEQLDGLLTDIAAGRGRPVLVEAPAGIGKSALLDHAVALARSRGIGLLRAAGRELETGIAFGVARTLVEPWLFDQPPAEREALWSGPAARARPLFDASTDGSGDEFDLVHGLYWLVLAAARQAPTVVMVDDAHWADASSLQLLVYLAGRLDGRPLGVLAAARPDEDPTGLLDQLATEPGVTTVRLGPLSPDATARLVAGTLPDAGTSVAARCHELTGGNPFQVHALIAAMRDDKTLGSDAALEATATRAARSLARSIQRRLRARSAEANRLAAVVAVAEGGIALRTAAPLAELDALGAIRAADELASADLFRPGDRLEFAHPLVRQAVHDVIPADERVALHASLATQLLADGAPDERVAEHLLHTPPSGDDEVGAVLRRAASRALAAGDARGAARYLRRALDDTDDRHRVDVLAALGAAEWRAGERDAIEHLDAAVEASTNPLTAALYRRDLARALHDFSDATRACDVLEVAMRELPDDPSLRELRLELEAAYLTSAVMVPQRAAGAHRRAGEIFADPDLLGTRAGRTLASKVLSMRTYQQGTRDGLRDLAHRLMTGSELIEELATMAVSHVIIALSFCDDYAGADHVLALVRDETERGGWETFRSACLTLSARQLVWTGPISRAVAEARVAVDDFAKGRQLYLPSGLCVLVRGLIESDRLDDADAAMRLLDGQPPPQAAFAAWVHESTARLAAARGDHQRALLAGLEWGRRADEALVKNPALFHWRTHTGLAALHAGDSDLATELIAEELRLAEAFGAPRAIAVARRAAAALTRGQDALDLLEDAVALCRDCGARVEEAQSLLELGGAVRREGRRSDARAILHDAIALAEQVDSARIAREARAELTLAGGRPPRSRQPTELTASERRIAELAASGLTNRQIASQLFVSVKNVEWHLANAYRRLGIARRGELGQALERVATDT
jgi:DNA-binding CsgD family transcriptional regulator